MRINLRYFLVLAFAIFLLTGCAQFHHGYREFSAPDRNAGADSTGKPVTVIQNLKAPMLDASSMSVL
jgi:hypothetical protein